MAAGPVSRLVLTSKEHEKAIDTQLRLAFTTSSLIRSRGLAQRVAALQKHTAEPKAALIEKPLPTRKYLKHHHRRGAQHLLALHASCGIEVIGAVPDNLPDMVSIFAVRVPN